MVSAHEASGSDVIGVLELDGSHDRQFGNCGLIDFERTHSTRVDIKRLHDKKPGRLAIAEGETVLRTCGRYVCKSHVFEYIEKIRAASGISGDGGDSGAAEFDEVPVYQEIIRERGAIGTILPPPLFDVGHPLGYASANGYWAKNLADS